MPKISVLIPCYNAMTVLPQTLDMLHTQSFMDWEAVFIDDGSSDDTPTILLNAAIADPRIRVFRKSNGGPALARNTAVQIAKGEVLSFLDVDDVWHPDRLQQIFDRFHNADTPDAVFGKTVFFSKDADRPRSSSAVPNHPLTIVDFLGENPVCTMSNLSVRAEVFARTTGFDTTMSHAEDLEWLMRLAATGAKIVGDPKIVTFYRTSIGGLSSDLEAMHAGWRRASRLASQLDPNISSEDLQDAEAVHLRYLSRRALRINAPTKVARDLVVQALRCSPRGFFSDRRRGVFTLAAAFMAPLIPGPLRRATFCS